MGGGDVEVDAFRAVVDVEKGDDAIEANGVGTRGWMPKSMQSSRLSTDAWLDLPDPATRQDQCHTQF